MLTSDLVRTQTNGGVVEPQYLDPTSEEARKRARALVEIFDESDSEPRKKIDDAVEQVTDLGTDYKIWRGLAKLLYDRSQFETIAPKDPRTIRETVFELAADTPGAYSEHWRNTVLESTAEKLDVSPEKIESTLYADLEDRQRLVDFDGIEPLQLIHRYNLALAQAVLYKATRLVVDLRNPDPNRLRYLFHVLKFNRLMHRCTRTTDGYRLEIDGPASLFSRNRKYGIRLARFLPAVLHAGNWHMTADLDWDDENEALFELSPDDGLVSHYSPTAQWKAEEERHLEQQFEDKETDWVLSREGNILELDDNQVLIPDYRLSRGDTDKCYLEIIGFWRLDYLQRRLQLLEQADEMPLILAVSDKLKTGRKQLEHSPAEVFFFKTVILVDKVLQAASQLAAS